MRAPLSVIIPTLDSAASLGPTLASVFEAVEDGLLGELILADGGSSDAISELADEVGALLVQAPQGRGGQMAAGALAAQGDWLLFLHSDTVLSNGWPAAVRAHMAHGRKAGYFQLRFDAEGFAPRFVAGWANLRASLFGLPYGDQGLLIPSLTYRQTGGFQDIPLMEDVALARALRGNLRPLQATATTSATRYLQEGWFWRGGRNLGLLAQYFLGRSPEKLAKRYQNRRRNQ